LLSPVERSEFLPQDYAWSAAPYTKATAQIQKSMVQPGKYHANIGSCHQTQIHGFLPTG